MHRVARVMEDVISHHFPRLNTVMLEPHLRTADDHEALSVMVASSELIAQLRDKTGDKLDARIALAITAAVVAAYKEAQSQGGQR